MGCSRHEEFVYPSLTEEMVLNYDFLPKAMHGWRRYRIEYGFECSCPEGTIWLPPDVDSDEVEKIFEPYLVTTDIIRGP